MTENVQQAKRGLSITKLKDDKCLRAFQSFEFETYKVINVTRNISEK